jgi:hypothetical protein
MSQASPSSSSIASEETGETEPSRSPRDLATAYLSYLGVRREWVGPVLWPAVVIHAALTLLLARLPLKPGRRQEGR